ncbi:hypothetical protein MIR68_012335 [Amoeboaphelidium protococcarum]|nr:hypothetical protein MIR68_012335 [Amoeboaphelidium protococcarum]
MAGKQTSAWSAILGDDAEDGDDLHSVPTIKINANQNQHLIASIRQASKTRSALDQDNFKPQGNTQQGGVAKDAVTGMQSLNINNNGSSSSNGKSDKDPQSDFKKVRGDSDASTIKLSKLQNPVLQQKQSVDQGTNIRLEDIKSDLEDFLGFDDDDDGDDNGAKDNSSHSNADVFQQQGTTATSGSSSNSNNKGGKSAKSLTTSGGSDFDLDDISALADESSQSRKPLQLPQSQSSASSRANVSNSASGGSSNGSKASLMSYSDQQQQQQQQQGKKPAQILTNNQVDDIADFLNDDVLDDGGAAQRKGVRKQTSSVFGSFTPSQRYAASSKQPALSVAATQVKVQSELVEFDCSYGQALPVSNWGNVIKVNKKTLKYLCLSQNAVAMLPDFSMASELLQVDASFNKLKAVPNVTGLNKLQELYLQNNNIASFTDLQLANLRVLDLAKNQITSLDGVSRLKSLTRLDVSCNQLAALPSDLQKCTMLTHLNVSGNKLTAVDDKFFVELKALKGLHLGRNQLKQAPSSISKLVELQELDLSGNEPLKSLSNISFDRFVNLRVLNVSHTSITSVPDAIGQCQQMLLLNLRKCSIQKVPNSITKNNKAIEIIH